MIQQIPVSHARKRHISARSCLTIVAMMVVCLPAVAADHNVTPRVTFPSIDDSFAIYNAVLNSAASRALKDIGESRKSAHAFKALEPPQISLAAMTATSHDARSSWQRVKRFLPVMEPILSQVGIPLQLAAVVLVESGGDPAALSAKGARGLWQLMPDTARRYGLTVNAETDQRLDVLKSTRAAAEYLRDLYTEFHNWPLALAAYNAGEQAVQRALTQTGGVTFSAAAKALPVETQNYVPAVFNALSWFSNDPLHEPTDEARFEQAVYATDER